MKYGFHGSTWLKYKRYQETELEIYKCKKINISIRNKQNIVDSHLI